MNRTDRLYAITEALRSAGRRGRTSTWLAAHFSVSTRTIKRDIAALLEAGTPISGQDGRGGGYQLDQRLALPPITFTVAEVTAVAIALSADPTMPFATDGKAALDKILGAMSKQQRESAAKIAERMWMIRGDSRSPVTNTIEQCIREQHVVHLDYTNEKGVETLRRPVEPMALARTHGHWHLLGWCRLRNTGRWFRIDRISAAWATRISCTERVLGEVFGEPPTYAQSVTLPI